MNSSGNDISDQKFTIISPRNRFEDKHTLLYWWSLKENCLRHTWKAYNQYNDYFAQRGATIIENKREENERDTMLLLQWTRPITNAKHLIYSTMRVHIPREEEEVAWMVKKREVCVHGRSMSELSMQRCEKSASGRGGMIYQVRCALSQGGMCMNEEKWGFSERYRHMRVDEKLEC